MEPLTPHLIINRGHLTRSHPVNKYTLQYNTPREPSWDLLGNFADESNFRKGKNPEKLCRR